MRQAGIGAKGYLAKKLLHGIEIEGGGTCLSGVFGLTITGLVYYIIDWIDTHPRRFSRQHTATAHLLIQAVAQITLLCVAKGEIIVETTGIHCGQIKKFSNRIK